MVINPVNPATTSVWTKKLVDLLLPTVCAACGKLGPMICPGCMGKFTTINEPLCSRCGLPTAESGEQCAECRDNDSSLQQIRASFEYDEPLTTVIHRYKYEGLFALARPLGMLMAHCWPRWTSDPEVIVPVPLYARRQRSRGFNQASLLAQQLGSLIDIEVNDRTLKRIRNTKPQIELNPVERKENVREAFSAEPDSMKGVRVLLIDDVITTGATMASAADALLKAGARSVSAYCLARTV